MRDSWELANSYRSAMGSSVGAVANPQLPTYFGGLLDSIQLPNLAATCAPSEGMSKLMDGFALRAFGDTDEWQNTAGIGSSAGVPWSTRLIAALLLSLICPIGSIASQQRLFL
ncbi:hypothetical protein ACFYTS_21780 [Nocardia sp. NPDC004151]|uniref:hypothetical protein n=1 Tax=Nocardia sp. NPDC004151 TaxID=3364304 RepID=UPI0036B8EE02